MKHTYTDKKLQSAVDKACQDTHIHRPQLGGRLLLRPTGDMSFWNAESYARLDLIKSAIAALPEPENFEAHGKTWTRHTPGDPMPCDENHWIETINKSGGIMGQCYAKQWDWKAVNHVIGWRYAGEPESQQEPAWTPKVGDVVTLKSGGPKMTVTHADGDNIITAHAHNTEIVTMAWSAASLQPA